MIGCFDKKCRKSFHLLCALRMQCQIFSSSFEVYCPGHFIEESSRFNSSSEQENSQISLSQTSFSQEGSKTCTSSPARPEEIPKVSDFRSKILGTLESNTITTPRPSFSSSSWFSSSHNSHSESKPVEQKPKHSNYENIFADIPSLKSFYSGK